MPSMRQHYKMVSGENISVHFVTFICSASVPSSPPTSLSIVEVSPTTIRVTWDEVPAIERNGIITEYEVEYNQSTFDINTTQTVTVTSTMAELTGLHEYVDYFIRVRAYTRVGAGPYTADINTTTAEDGETSQRNVLKFFKIWSIYTQCPVELHGTWWFRTAVLTASVCRGRGQMK